MASFASWGPTSKPGLPAFQPSTTSSSAISFPGAVRAKSEPQVPTQRKRHDLSLPQDLDFSLRQPCRDLRRPGPGGSVRRSQQRSGDTDAGSDPGQQSGPRDGADLRPPGEPGS